MVKVPIKTFERKLIGQGHDLIIGVDEVGMACLAGPVVVCALAVEPSFYGRPHPKLAKLRDSKMLQAHQREYFAELLAAEAGLRWAIALCDMKVIDEINIYQASRRAMREAIKQVLGFRDQVLEAETQNLRPVVVVDGNKIIRDIPLPQHAIVGGDRKVWAIAAASILAKVHRDHLMIEYAAKYPGYGFERHKGYPTALHRARLTALGPCYLHRRSFKL